MKKVSSKATYFRKRIFPRLWFGFIGLSLLVFVLPKDEKPVPIPFFIFPVVMAVFGYFIMKKLIFDLMDEVYDCESYLLVKNGKDEDRIDLNNIKNVNFTRFTNPPRITLTLRNPSKFGSEVSFSPQLRALSWKQDPFIADLIDRIDHYRMKSANPAQPD